MPILSSIAGAAAKAYGMMANAKRIITDTFNRSDGSLGTSSSGYLWSVLRGTWSISSNQATSSDSGSTYPLATLDVGAQNVIVSADITNGGPGVAFWVTDANSWWASSVNYASTSCNCQTCGGDCASYNSCQSCTYCACALYYSCQNAACGTSTVYTCPSGCYYSSFFGQCFSNFTDDGCGPGTPTTVTNTCRTSACGCETCGTCANVSCGCASYNPTYSCNCNTCTTSSLVIYSSVSGSVSSQASLQIASQNNSSSFTTASSIKVSTSSNTITATAYSNTNLTTQLGSTLTLTPSSPTKGTKTGIIKTVSSANAGAIVDNFSTENVI